MAERESFLQRWSRLKTEVPPTPEPMPPPPCAEAEPEIDPADLPPIDSLGADSDYRAFLKVGVPAALRLAALRHAWVSDPLIAGFRGFGEYDWDCNAPGYGELWPVDDIRRLCDAVLRHHDPEPQPEPQPEPAEEAPRTLPGEPPDVVAEQPGTAPPPGEEA